MCSILRRGAAARDPWWVKTWRAVGGKTGDFNGGIPGRYTTVRSRVVVNKGTQTGTRRPDRNESAPQPISPFPPQRSCHAGPLLGRNALPCKPRTWVWLMERHWISRAAEINRRTIGLRRKLVRQIRLDGQDPFLTEGVHFVLRQEGLFPVCNEDRDFDVVLAFE
ncbi:hypothetical protein XA68_13292 [Ophiocordyceps unilateralis]|uniref:Uncharacterized protein n=1 Tax=Ophiocordyceps unilateralis TaxID=268505 RepID=A0A2A9PCU6_OPHUN|nr:hypothetical protein XA68_13292 [Ophiocordyceps unilateralis]